MCGVVCTHCFFLLVKKKFFLTSEKKVFFSQVKKKYSCFWHTTPTATTSTGLFFASVHSKLQ